jgi:hypothetical protein
VWLQQRCRAGGRRSDGLRNRFNNDAVPEAGAPMGFRNRFNNDAVPEAGAPGAEMICSNESWVWSGRTFKSGLHRRAWNIKVRPL